MRLVEQGAKIAREYPMRMSILNMPTSPMVSVKHLALAVGLCAGMLSVPVRAAEDASKPAADVVTPHENAIPPRQNWSFAGFFGKYDTAQLQRGFKVFREVCSNCHSANDLAFRNLADAGGPSFSESQVKALAAEYKVKDGPNDAGDMFDRPARPSDHWPAPFPNANAARAANGGGLPPDMSVLAKARDVEDGFPKFIFDALPFFAYQEGGPDYIVGILTGYGDPPKDMKMDSGQYFNHMMPGNKIAMPPPLSGDGQVEYTDGTPATVQQYAKDVAAYLMWMAEPKLDQRKRTGFRVLVFLIILSGLLYATKRRVWASVAH
jgi:ubiquinol-cytochrome c reductase cytochrome b/c1 subunit